MKERLLCCIRSIAVLLVLTMLFSLTFACLYYFNLIQTNSFHIANWIGGLLSFGAGGAILGFCIEKKALLHAFVIALLLGVLALCIGEHSLMGFLEIGSKLLSYLAFCMLFYARKHKG